MAATRGKLVEGGRVIVPSGFRRSMGLEKGDTVLMELHGDELRIRPAKNTLRRLQQKMQTLVPAGQSVVDELIQERHAEAERE